RAMLVPATTVPVTIVGAFAAMALLGFTVNLMTLFALILAIGIVVDDAIVIVENTSRYIAQGLAPREAAIRAVVGLTAARLGVRRGGGGGVVGGGVLGGDGGADVWAVWVGDRGEGGDQCAERADAEADAVCAVPGAGGGGGGDELVVPGVQGGVWGGGAGVPG